MPTFRGPIIGRQILLWVHISKQPEEHGQESPPLAFQALLDTGATITSISQKVIDELALAAHSWRPIAGVHGIVDTYTYMVNLAVPIAGPASSSDDQATQTVFLRGAHLEVASLTIQPKHFDILLGMDLLKDFHLTVFQDHFILSN